MASTSAVYRTAAARSTRCATHERDDAIGTCSLCRAAVCRACASFATGSVVCPSCAGRSMRSRWLSLAAALGVLGAPVVVLGLTLARYPSVKEQAPRAHEIVWKGALRSCNEGSALLNLLTLDEWGRSKLMMERATEFITDCGESAGMLGVAYRGACDANEADAARALKVRLAAQPGAKGWLLHPCPVLDGR